MVIRVSRSDVTETPLVRTFTDGVEPPHRLVLTMMWANPLTASVLASPENEVEYNGLIYGIHNFEQHQGTTDYYYNIQLVLRRRVSPSCYA